MKAFLFCILFVACLAESESCTACQFIVRAVEGLINNNATESVILGLLCQKPVDWHFVEFLEQACGLLPVSDQPTVCCSNNVLEFIIVFSVWLWSTVLEQRLLIWLLTTFHPKQSAQSLGSAPILPSITKVMLNNLTTKEWPKTNVWLSFSHRAHSLQAHSANLWPTMSKNLLPHRLPKWTLRSASTWCVASSRLPLLLRLSSFDSLRLTQIVHEHRWLVLATNYPIDTGQQAHTSCFVQPTRFVLDETHRNSSEIENRGPEFIILLHFMFYRNRPVFKFRCREHGKCKHRRRRRIGSDWCRSSSLNRMTVQEIVLGREEVFVLGLLSAGIARSNVLS